MEEPVYGNTVEPPAAGKVAISAKNEFGPSHSPRGQKGAGRRKLLCIRD